MILRYPLSELRLCLLPGQIIVDSMHARKVEMAKRVDAFVGLPGGFGTLEEVCGYFGHGIWPMHEATWNLTVLALQVMEVTTWTQIGIHCKRTSLAPLLLAYPYHLLTAVVLINIFGFYDPLKTMIDNGVRYGFIAEHSRNLVIFVDGPEDHASHATYDWGTAAVKAAAEWKGGDAQPLYKWTADGKPEAAKLAAT